MAKNNQSKTPSSSPVLFFVCLLVAFGGPLLILQDHLRGILLRAPSVDIISADAALEQGMECATSGFSELDAQRAFALHCDGRERYDCQISTRLNAHICSTHTVHAATEAINEPL